MSKIKLPILSDDGRTVIHPGVSSVGSARRWIIAHALDDGSKKLLALGWTLSVWARTDFHVELNGGLHGYRYCIGTTVGG